MDKIKILIKELLKKRTLKNGAWLYAMQIFNTVVPLLTLPYITRILGRSQYGVFSVALNLITYLQVLVEYGFIMSATREVALSDKKNTTLSKIFSNVICVRIFLYAISMIIVLGYLFVKKNDPTLCKCTITLLVCLLGYVVQQNWFFQGMNEMKYISIVNIIGRTVSTVLIFLLVKKPDDIVIYSLLYSVSPLLSGFVGICIVTGKFKIKFAFPSFSDMKKEFAAGFYVFTTSLSAKVFGAIGVTILGAMYASDIVGAFSAIQKIPNIVILMWTPISQIMYPIASRKNGESIKDGISFVRKVSGIILPLFAAGSLLMAVFSKQIVYIAFGEEYVQYSYWLIFLVIWMFFGIVNNFLGIQILLASGHDKEYSKCFQIGVAATVIINYIFISQIGGTGAAAAPAFSEILITVLLLIQVKKVMSL